MCAAMFTTSCSKRAVAGNASACRGLECAKRAYTAEHISKCFSSATYTAPDIWLLLGRHVASFSPRRSASRSTH